MSDARKPSFLILAAVLAIIIGVYSLIRGGLMLYYSIQQFKVSSGGILDLIIGLLSAGVGVLALAGGINVLRGRPGCIDLMKKYAIAIFAYQIVWAVFSIASGRQVGWGSMLLDIFVGAATFVYITTNDEVKGYSVSCGNAG
jgi:hypothetical protein